MFLWEAWGSNRLLRLRDCKLTYPPFEFDDSYTLWPLFAPYPPLDSVNSSFQAQIHPWMVSTWPNLAQFHPSIVPTWPNLSQVQPPIVATCANLARFGPIPLSDRANLAQFHLWTVPPASNFTIEFVIHTLRQIHFTTRPTSRSDPLSPVHGYAQVHI